MNIHSKIAELSLLHTALGNGFVDPFEDQAVPHIVATSAIHHRAQNFFAMAENDFLRKAIDSAHAEHVNDEEETSLERILKPSDRKSKPKKNKKITLVTWRDPGACRTTLIEMMNRSKYETLTMLDAHGARLAVALSHPTRTASEGALVALTGNSSAEVSIIRSAVSGGSTIHGALQSKSRFSYIAAVSERTLVKMRKQIPKQSRFNAWLSNTVMIPGWTDSPSGLSLKKEDFTWCIENVLTKNKDKITIPIDGQNEWDAFFESSADEIASVKLSAGAQEKLRTMPAALSAILYQASKIAIAEAFLLHARTGVELKLCSERLATARAAACIMLEFACSVDVFAARAKNAAKARDAQTITPSLLAAAYTNICRALDNDPIISRHRALQIEFITPTMLTEMTRNGMLTELTGIVNIRMGRTTRAYTAIKTQMTDEEAVVEFMASSVENPPTESEERETISSITTKAERNYSVGTGPVVHFSEMSAVDLRISPIIKDRKDLFEVDYAGKRIIVRKDSTGQDMANWNLPLSYSVERWKNQ